MLFISHPSRICMLQTLCIFYIYVNIGYYDMANDHLLLHDHCDHAINDYDAVALDDPAQGQALPPAPLCTDLTFLYTHI
jgi:hypothetical protein